MLHTNAGLLGSCLTTVIVLHPLLSKPCLEQIVAVDICKQVFRAHFKVLLLEVIHECDSIDDVGKLSQWNLVESSSDIVDDWIESNRQYIVLGEALLLIELLILAKELAADSISAIVNHQAATYIILVSSSLIGPVMDSYVFDVQNK